MARVIDMTGQRFGSLTVIKRGEDYISPRNHHIIRWVCRCDCGNLVTTEGAHLRDGATKSCGCRRGNHYQVHGLTGTRLYHVWQGMKKRCYNPTHVKYFNYGGRGITICDEWLHDFKSFHDWSMANGYDEHAPRGKCTIDRIDNNKGYSPDNCRWIDTKTQNNNRRPRSKKRCSHIV